MSDQASERGWLQRFHAEVKPRLHKALVHLDAEVHRRGTFFTSVVSERSGAREVEFHVGPFEAQHTIRFVYTGAGRLTVDSGPHTAEYSIDALDQAKVDEIARTWLTTVGVLKASP